MSRTDKDRPWRVQREVLPPWVLHIYPPPVGGAWEGRKWWARFRNRQLRHHQKEALIKGEEIPVSRRGVHWDVF